LEKARATLQRYLKMTAAAASADGWLLAGIVEQELGAPKEAQRLFEQGLNYHPHDPILRYNLGQLYFHANDFAAAEAAWQNLDDTLQDPSLHHLRALAAYRQGQHARALDMLSRAIALDERAEYFDLRGVLLHKKGDEQGAKAAFKRALQLDPQLRSAQLNLALLGQNPQDAASALAAAREQFASCSSDCGEMALQLAIVLYYQKKLDEAIAVLERCAEKDKDERIYRHLAIFYREQGQWDKSIGVLQQARKRYVLSAQSEGELAEALLLAGRYGEAIELYTGLLGKWEGNPWRLYYQLGFACLEQNELEKAKNYFERSLKSKSDNVAARGLLAFVYNRLGNRRQARSLWEQNLKDDPTNPVLLINLALMHESSGELLKALDYYQKALQLNPSEKTVELNVGNVYAALGRTADAQHAYAQALQSPRREEAAYNIFLVAQKDHQQGRAEEMISLLKTEFPHSPFTTRAVADKQLASGDTTAALRGLESLKQKQAEDWYVLARVYAQRGAVEQARSALQQLPRDSLWRSAATAVSAQLAYVQGDCATALSLWQSMADTTFAARYNRALVSYTCKRYAEVVAGGSGLVAGATGADRADVCRLVGNAAFALKEWDKARRWYRQLSVLEAQDAIVQYNLAVASYNLNELDEAWKHYQSARTLDVSIVNKDIEQRYQQRSSAAGSSVAVPMAISDSLYNRAVDLQQQGEDEEAQALYRTILEQDSMHIHSWNNLGALLAARGELDEAEQCYLRAVKRRFDLPESYANLVTLYLAQGNFKEARRWVIKGRGHNPDSELLQRMEKTVAESMAVQR
jgi:tetratricopeptide (TPR) repeat protein